MDEPGSDETQRQLVELYLSLGPEKLETLERLLLRGETEQLKREAHSLKSTSLNMGCDQLADYCQQIESGSGNARALVADCKAEFQRVVEALLKLYP